MTISLPIQKLTAEQKFMLSVIIVNAGNYIYNLALGRILGPVYFADAALLITLLLVLSFVAMTFQLATAKFSVLYEHGVFTSFINMMYRWGALTGIIIGCLITIFAKDLQELFHTQTHWMFTVFGIGVPIYFMMSINRGAYQGKRNFVQLAMTYQSEMISRLLLTLFLVYTFTSINSSILIVTGILVSLVLGLFPFKYKVNDFKLKSVLNKQQKKQITNFFILTGFYELTQIIINNSDILMVKHYFNEYDAGLYASLALIGRVVYFVTWMFVMLLLPTVIQKRKDGQATAPILFKYVGYVIILSLIIVSGCFIFPEFVIKLMFGSEYLSIAPLLWKYAIATSLFAVANIYAYYFLSLDHYLPVIISGIFGFLQIALIKLFHSSLLQVVSVQIIAMAALLLFQLVYFLIQNKFLRNLS